MSKYGLLSPDFPPDSSMLQLDHPLLLTLQAQIYFFLFSPRSRVRIDRVHLVSFHKIFKFADHLCLCLRDFRVIAFLKLKFVNRSKNNK